MKRCINFLGIVAIIFLFSCSGENNTEKSGTQDTATVTTEKKSPYEKTNLSAHIKELESKITDTAQINRGVAMDLMLSYAKYATLYPNDSASAEYLYKAGDIARSIGEGRNAVNYYKRILNDYPNYKKRAITMFMLAFTYENIMNDTANARRYYTEFVKDYPKHEFADDARQLLKFLGKNPETIVKQFEKK